jgi:hypothetical protein
MEQSRQMDDMRQEMREGFADVRSSIRSMDDKMSRQFMWLVGIQVTSLLALMAMLINRG